MANSDPIVITIPSRGGKNAMSRYRLDDLGWFQFEQLCQSLLKAELGIAVESWGGTSDLGRDAYCEESLAIAKGRRSAGPFLFQAKYVAGANATGARPFPQLKKAIVAETVRIKSKLHNKSWKRLNYYVLLTNVPATAKRRKAVEDTIHATLPKAKIIVWGANDLADMLDRSPQLRASFPQILGLRDLNELLDQVVSKSIRERSSLAIDLAKELTPVFVPTQAYNRTHFVLSQHGFVVLSGPPEMGKTTIGRIVGLAKLAQGWECHECRGPDDLFQTFQRDARQVFIADDAFGSTEFRPELAQIWGGDIEKILRLLGPAHWLILTTRTAPLKAALERMHLQGKARRFPKPAEVVVDASNLTETEKALILYRHAKAAALIKGDVELIREHATTIVEHEHFTPERARRLIADRLPELREAVRQDGSHEAIDAVISEEITTPTASMQKSFHALEAQFQDLLIAMLDSTLAVARAASVLEMYERMNAGRNTTKTGPDVAETLEGHFIRRLDRVPFGELETMDYQHTHEEHYQWLHPSWRDLIIEHLTKSGSARMSFLQHCSTQGLLLALSGAGGVAGERAMPLLVDESDWKLLDKRVCALLGDGQEADMTNILDGLHDASIRLFQESGEHEASRQRLTSLVGHALAMCRDRWDQEGLEIDVNMLELYYSLSEFVIPLPSGPNLEATWETLCSAAQEELSSNKDHTQINHAAVDTWLTFCRILSKNEPRLLRQVHFPGAYMGLLDAYYESISHLGDDELLDLDSADDYDGEISILEAVQAALSELTAVVPKFSKEGTELWNRIGTNVDAYADKRSEEFPEPDESDYYGEDYRTSTAAIGPLSQFFGIGKIFSDL